LSTFKHMLLISVLIIFLFVCCLNSVPEALLSDENEAEQAIDTARQTIIDCYEATVKAESEGANITGLTIRLNEAGNLFSKALLARKNKDYNLATQLASECIAKLNGFIDEANELSEKASNDRYCDFIYNVVCSIAGAMIIICVGFAVWITLKRRYSNGRLRVNPENYRIIFLIVILVSALFAASPALSRLQVYPRTEFFSELWILDSNHQSENYPSNISSNQNYKIYLGIGNHLGYCAYYMVKVKFRNQTQPAPESFGSIESRLPSTLPSLFNITAFVADERILEIPLTFSFNYTWNKFLSRVELSGLRLNNVWLNMSNYTVSWDNDKRAFRGFLFFEMWLYNTEVNNFQYHGRFVGLWLNMTAY